MKEKMLQVKEYVIAHKKQVIIGAALGLGAIIGGKLVISKLKGAEEIEDELVEIATGSIDEVKEA